MHFHEAVRGVSGNLEGLRRGNTRNRIHLVLDEVTYVGAIVEMLKPDVEVGRCGLVRGLDPLAENRTCGGIALAKTNTDSGVLN